jgi:hypothetical protein
MTKREISEAIGHWTTLEFPNKNNTVMVEWEYLDEGYSGDYDDSDLEDSPLLRFTVYKKGKEGWEQIDDSSYCTHVSILTPKEVLQKLAEYILWEVEEQVESGYSIKKLCEKLSWINEKYIEEGEKDNG